VQHRLQFALRGPENAFAIVDGDWAAFEEVAAVCCDIWNGANSLVVTVNASGELTTLALDTLLTTRDVEHVYVHGTVNEAGREALSARFGERTIALRSMAFRHELHPLDLQPSFREGPERGPRVVLPIPVYDDVTLRRLARLVYGRIEDEKRDEYAKAFRLEEHEGEAAHFALVDGQVSALSPLGQSTYLMRAHRQADPLRARQLVILDGNDFNELVYFWNLRSRTTLHSSTPAVVAVPAQGLATPERLRSLRDWTERGEVIKPDILVLAGRHREATTAALEELGYRQPAEERLSEYYGRVPEERQAPEYSLAGAGLLGGPMRRGVWNEQLVTLEPGRNVVRFEPKGFATARSGGYVRLDLLNWPLPFRPTARTAKRVHENALVHQDVVCLLTSATNGPLTFDLVVPGFDDVLADFLAARGMSARLSAAGRYAQALIGRLGGPQRLEELARPEALDILQPLTSQSRLKLLQRLERMLRERYGEQTPPTAELAEMIRGQLIALDLPASTLGDLATQTKRSRAELVQALEPLIDVGFIRRGRSERCPQCGFEDFYSLSEVDERLSCHACRQAFLLAVAAGPDEPRLAYQLDPLMARAMDQDLLPVLLTLRYLYSPEGAAAGAFWPGLEITGPTETLQDCDILLAQSGSVTVCECKSAAAGLSLAQAEATLALAEQLGARTIFAALNGEFAEEIGGLSERAQVRLLTRTQLVSGA
jgi:DNA-binding MarR family transcriptional regulator